MNRPTTQTNPQPGTCCGGADVPDRSRGEAEAQAVAREKEGGLKPGGDNTPGGALNTGPNAGGRGMGTNG